MENLLRKNYLVNDYTCFCWATENSHLSNDEIADSSVTPGADGMSSNPGSTLGQLNVV